jgi:hypothetical protein
MHSDVSPPARGVRRDGGAVWSTGRQGPMAEAGGNLLQPRERPT